MLLPFAELIALTLALAARQPVEPPPALTEHDLALIGDCAASDDTREAERAGWTIIDARGMTSSVALHAALLRAAQPGKRVVIYRGAFRNAEMQRLGAKLAKACFVDTMLDGSNWEGTAIAGLRLVRVSLREAKLARVRWPGLWTYGSNLEGSDFSGADLTDLHFVSGFQGASFAGTRFRGANLGRARFACGITSDVWCINGGPDFANADLTDADVSGLGLWEPELNAGAVLDRTIVAPRSLPHIGKARIAGPLRLATYYTSPYGEDEAPVSVEVSAADARLLIDAAIMAGAPDDSPSFDCARAATVTERLICGEYQQGLRNLDRELAAVWRAVRAAGKGDLAGQRRWLAARSECGEDTGCLQDRYEARIAVLRGALGPGLRLAPGASVTYHSDILPLPEALRRGALYTRILPVLIDASYQRVTLTGLAGGAVAATGDAIGGNAHMCNLGAEAARFDPATGWWSARTADGRKVPLFRVDGRQIHFRYSGNLGNTPVEASDFISCGARAGFTSGIDLSPR